MSIMMSDFLPNGYLMHPTGVEDVEKIAALEIESFPVDEAASLESIMHRQSHAGKFFLNLKYSGSRGGQDGDCAVLVGFVNGTCCTGNTILEESMSTHDPNGRTLVIHSVTIAADSRRKGLGCAMLKAYVQYVACTRSVDLVLLLCKSNLLQFYIDSGFSLVGQSHVEHGQDTWFEMKLDISELNSTEQLQIDAFTTKAFSGNQAAVVFLHRSDEWMQSIAAENNFAETSFLQELPIDASDSHDSHFFLRWFTPVKEVELCGHATLAAAHALYESKRVPLLQRIKFETKYSGILTAQGRADGTIELGFPSTPAAAVQLTDEDMLSLTTALSIPAAAVVFTGRSMYDLLVEITREAFQSLPVELNFSLIALLGGRGVLVTCAGAKRSESIAELTAAHDSAVCNREFDFVSRCFFPRYGINEDPVTGSAHCALAPYWFQRFNISSTDEQLVGYQASTRGGVVKVQMAQDIVILSGSCVTTMKTKILV